MKVFRFFLLSIVAITLFLSSCSQTTVYGDHKDHFRVISNTAKIYRRPIRIAEVMGELKLGDEVYCREQNPSREISEGWLEAKSGTITGYIETRDIANDDTYGLLEKMIEEAKSVPASASGKTGKKTTLKMKPDKGSRTIGILKGPHRVDVLERLVVKSERKGKTRRGVWYRVRLEDGRVGYVPARRVDLLPPREINQYTSIRVPVSWYLLQEKTDAETGKKARDYLVSYASVGSDIETDFTRIELYTYDMQKNQYGTALAKSGMYGVLPITITDTDDGRKMIEIKEHPHGNKSKMHVTQYSFPSPITVVNEYTEEIGNIK